MNESSFGGPGSPIICILGGEGAVSPSTGIFYPSIIVLAERLSALVIEPEHRFYGTSQPVPPFDTRRLQLLTAQQALADAASFIEHTRFERNCTGRGGQPRCPVITVGGSYPGFLSAMMRVRYPEVVDMAYAGSAPMGFYAQAVDQYAYYKVITQSAERAVPGCAAAVRQVVAATLGASPTKAQVVTGANLCKPLPDYIASGPDSLLVDELSMVVMYSFANLNMANYPPSSSTGLARACQGIVAGVAQPWPALAGFLGGFASPALAGFLGAAAVAQPGRPSACYNLSSQLPSGVNATISSGDWSGVGTGDDGSAWDLETCSLLVEAIGANGVSDMFLAREWTIEWLNAHCAARFGPEVQPRPRYLADVWGFDADRLPHVSSRIIFTNGLNDGWSAGGILTNLSATLLAFNAPDGAHHSDLSHLWPSDADTPDVVSMRASVHDTLARWVAELSP